MADRIPLPALFVERMRALLGDEAEAFLASYEQPATSGLRINTLKIDVEAFRRRAPWPLERIPWAEAGFSIPPDIRAGKHPWHAAGLYYLQEPSAMAAVEALDVRPGQLVLDLAASPGGKATHIASLLGDSGLLLANELVSSRIKPLGENLERWGATNVVLLNEEPVRLAERLGPVFDRVLLDAPCSGEGMFRKTPSARAHWSQEHVAGSAARQEKILETAARLVRPGGRLVYSTCTFSCEENEERVASFLDAHRDWEMAAIEMRPGFATGFTGARRELSKVVRLWPHRLAGEGHFVAALRRTHGGKPDAEAMNRPPTTLWRAQIAGVDRDTKQAMELFHEFARDNLREPVDVQRLTLRNDQIYLLPEQRLALDGLRVVREGLWLGTVKPGRFEPSHALAMALRANDVTNRVEIELQEAERYLAGHPISADGASGWALVTLDDVPLGWGRRTGSIVKNHYPKGLRWM